MRRGQSQQCSIRLKGGDRKSFSIIMIGNLVCGGTNSRSRKIGLSCRCSALFSLFPLYLCTRSKSFPKSKIKTNAGGLGSEEKKCDSGKQAEGKEVT